MYTIIGGDGKEYGPVPTDQIHAWIAVGRANLDTRAKLLGTDEWKRLGDFPAFTGGAAAEPPLVDSPAAPHGTAEEIAADLIARASPLDIASCYERGWNLLKANFWPLVGVTLLIYAIQVVVAAIPYLGLVGTLLIAGALKGGLFAYFLKKARGQPADISDAFSGFGPLFLPLFLVTLASTVITIAGLILLIIPGIYLAVGYLFIYLLMVDRKLDFWTAMEVSRKVITKQWWRIFGLVLLGILFAILGLACLVVGIFVALPFVLGAITYAYEDLCNPKKPDHP